MANKGDLRIWHNSNFGTAPFSRPAKSLRQAVEHLELLASYDLYLGDLISANAQGLEEFDGVEWVEWEDEHTGYNIDEYADSISGAHQDTGL